MGTPSEGGTSEIILKVTAASAGIDPDDVQTQVVGLAPGVFDLVTSGRIGGYVVSLDTAVALREAAARGGHLLAVGRRRERRAGLHHLAGTGRRPGEAGAADQLPRRDQGSRAVRRRGRGQRLRRDDRVPLRVRDPHPRGPGGRQGARSPSTSSRGPRPARRRSPGPCPSSGRRSTRRCPARASSPRAWTRRSGSPTTSPRAVTSRQPAGAGPGSPTHVGATPSGVPEAEAGAPAGQEDRMTIATTAAAPRHPPGCPAASSRGPPGRRSSRSSGSTRPTRRGAGRCTPSATSTSRSAAASSSRWSGGRAAARPPCCGSSPG